MELSAMNEAFHSDFLEVIKFDVLIELIKSANPKLTTSFIIGSLDVERERLENIDHVIPLIFASKKTEFETINGKGFIPPIGDRVYDWGKFFDSKEEKEVMPNYDYIEWRFGLTFSLLNYYSINKNVVYESINSSDKHGTFETFESFNEWITEFHIKLEHDDIYILKSDALALVSDLLIPDEHILLIKYHRFIGGALR